MLQPLSSFGCRDAHRTKSPSRLLPACPRGRHVGFGSSQAERRWRAERVKVFLPVPSWSLPHCLLLCLDGWLNGWLWVSGVADWWAGWPFGWPTVELSWRKQNRQTNTEILIKSSVNWYLQAFNTFSTSEVLKHRVFSSTLELQMLLNHSFTNICDSKVETTMSSQYF